jgi:hypothetical protein
MVLPAKRVSVDELLALVQPLLGLPSWNVQRGHGSFLTFEFGQPHLVSHEPRERRPTDPIPGRRRLTYAHGDWHLWVYCCQWAASQEGVALAHSESTDAEIDTAMRALGGQALSELSLDTARTTFHFDLGGKLETQPFDDESEQWHLYMPSSGSAAGSVDDGCD